MGAGPQDRHASWRFFLEALESDVADIQGGTTSEGIHLGAMAGTIDLLQRCYAGMRMHDDVLCLDPMLPPELGRLDLELTCRGCACIMVALAHDTATVGLELPLVSAPRMFAAVVLVLGLITCALCGDSEANGVVRGAYIRLMSALGGTALVSGLVALATGNHLALAVLVGATVHFWMIATVRHLASGKPERRRETERAGV